MAVSGSASASRTWTRIAEAMQPHLFNDSQPPDVQVAALGDHGRRDRGGAARAEGASDASDAVDAY